MKYNADKNIFLQTNYNLKISAVQIENYYIKNAMIDKLNKKRLCAVSLY